MAISQFLRWQWEGYPTYHGSRANLLLHIVAVPAFLAGNVGLLCGLISASGTATAAGLAAMVASVALQGRGHRWETTPPQPFTSPANAVTRIFLEQWITFPRFVLSGRWWRALNVAAAR